MSKLPTKKNKMYLDLIPMAKHVAFGTVLVIDPSIGSTSSSPGVALYDEGIFIFSAAIYTGGSHLPLWRRARTLGRELTKLCTIHNPTVLIYEDIPATSGFNQNAVASLLKAVGVTLACTSSDYVLGVHPTAWKRYVRDTYVKGDANDAEEIGYIAVETAKTILT